MFPIWLISCHLGVKSIKTGLRLGAPSSSRLAALTKKYITQVSLTWSTDPKRALTVVSIYRAHASSLLPKAA